MKAQMIARVAVSIFSAVTISAAVAQVQPTKADEYNPTNNGGPSTTLGQGRGLIKTGPSAVCNCYNSGTPGHIDTYKGVQYCVPGC